MVNMNLQTANRVRIGIIDIFGKKKCIPLNSVVKDFTHGELTSSVLFRLTEDLPVSIKKFPVRVRNNGNDSFGAKSLLKQLKKINNDGKNLDYLNISSSFVMPYELGGISSNIEQLKDPNIQQMFRRMLPEQVKHIIAELERITQSGTKVFISSCNKPKGFNALSLAEGVHTIGGRNGATLQPIKRFSSNPLVESYENLPVYISKEKSVLAQKNKTAVNFTGLVPIRSELAQLSRWDLTKKIATKNDYERLQHYVDELYATGKFNFDIDFMRFKLVSSVDKSLRNKIYDLEKFKKIFEGKFDEEVLKYTFPQGTHCDLQFRQFFNMKSKSKHVLPMTKTTKIPNTVSGTSFAAPQGLNRALRQDLAQKGLSYIC